MVVLTWGLLPHAPAKPCQAADVPFRPRYAGLGVPSVVCCFSWPRAVFGAACRMPARTFVVVMITAPLYGRHSCRSMNVFSACPECISASKCRLSVYFAGGAIKLSRHPVTITKFRAMCRIVHRSLVRHRPPGPQGPRPPCIRTNNSAAGLGVCS